MAGIYVHIPFCKQICHYCDFYKIANNRLYDEFLKAILVEVEYRKDIFPDMISTIYFGGGTPSALPIAYIEKILGSIKSIYNMSDNLEVTIEINPDDVSFDYYKNLILLGFNRLSIGIQSFNDTILKFLNRRHSAQTALTCVRTALDAGFTNISVDLIYGIPSQSVSDFKSDLNIVSVLNIAHLSAYHLGIEEGTYFGKLKQHNRMVEIDEEESNKFYNTLLEWANENFFEHYEVSSFAREQKYSRHNMNYWFHVPYLSFGPSAHSYFNNQRFFNIANLKSYIDNVLNRGEFFDSEHLSEKDIFNEYMMLRLRTKWGLDLEEVKNRFSDEYYSKLVRRFSDYEDSDYIRMENSHLKLTEKGFFMSDFIIRNFFIT